jgi:hypothetical protein
VVVLVEHQSDTDPMMPLRLLYFAVVYWDQQWRAWEELPSPKPPFRLNPVLPVVLYTGATPWGSNRTLADLLAEPEAFHAFAPVWQPLFWNLAEQSPEELLASDNHWLHLMAVLRVEAADTATFKDVFTRAVQQVKKIKRSEKVRWHDLMRILLSWVYWRRPSAERPTLLATAAEAQASARRKEEIQQMASKLEPSWWDLAFQSAKEQVAEEATKQGLEQGLQQGLEQGLQQGLEQGLQQGLEQGLQQGEQEGQLKALRDVLKTMLQDRFGQLSKKLQKQIDAVNDTEQLRQGVFRVHNCAALADFHL